MNNYVLINCNCNNYTTSIVYYSHNRKHKNRYFYCMFIANTSNRTIKKKHLKS